MIATSSSAVTGVWSTCATSAAVRISVNSGRRRPAKTAVHVLELPVVGEVHLLDHCGRDLAQVGEQPHLLIRWILLGPSCGLVVADLWSAHGELGVLDAVNGSVRARVEIEVPTLSAEGGVVMGFASRSVVEAV